MKAQQIKNELLKIWPDGVNCQHIHAATAFKLLDEAIKKEGEMEKTRERFIEVVSELISDDHGPDAETYVDGHCDPVALARDVFYKSIQKKNKQ